MMTPERLVELRQQAQGGWRAIKGLTPNDIIWLLDEVERKSNLIATMVEAIENAREARADAERRNWMMGLPIFEDKPCPGCGRTDVHPDQATCQSEAWADEWYCSEACYTKSNRKSLS